jgi:hypothetical protein
MQRCCGGGCERRATKSLTFLCAYEYGTALLKDHLFAASYSIHFNQAKHHVCLLSQLSFPFAHGR